MSVTVRAFAFSADNGFADSSVMFRPSIAARSPHAARVLVVLLAVLFEGCATSRPAARAIETGHNGAGRAAERETALAAETTGPAPPEATQAGAPPAEPAAAEDRKTPLEALIDRTRDLPPIGFDVPLDFKMPPSLVFQRVSSREAFRTIAGLAGLSLVFDPAFRESPVTVDVRNGSLQDALNAVLSASRTFFRVVAPRTLVIVPDTPAMRREWAEEVVRTFYVSNADLKETIDLLRLVVDLRHIAPMSGTNAITIWDTPENVAAAARIIAAIDKPRPEVVIDVEFLQVDRTSLQELGLQVASPGAAGVDGQVAVVPAPAPANGTAGAAVSLQVLGALGSADVVLANLPELAYRLLKSDTHTRTLANPELRTIEGVAAQARLGDRLPVPVTTFAPVATGGVAQQPITSYNYEDVGVNLDVTPRVHHDADVTLLLKLEVSGLEATSGFGGLPTFSSRQINTVIRLRDGQTSVIAGLIRQDQTRILEGIPGLSDIPGLGRLMAHTETERTTSDVIVTVRPRVVRSLSLAEADLAAFRIGVEGGLPAAGRATPPSSEGPGAPAIPRGVTGTWVGDLATLPGVPQMTWTLTESGVTVNGSVQVTLNGGFVVLSGALTGTLADSTLTYTITVPPGGFSIAPTCAGQLTGTASVTDAALSGNVVPGALSCVPPITTLGFTLVRP